MIVDIKIERVTPAKLAFAEEDFVQRVSSDDK